MSDRAAVSVETKMRANTPAGKHGGINCVLRPALARTCTYAAPVDRGATLVRINDVENTRLYDGKYRAVVIGSTVDQGRALIRFYLFR